MELCNVVDSTVSHCHYEDDATIIWMALSKEIQRLGFYVLFVGQIIDSNGCTFAFKMHVFPMDKKAWLFKNKSN